MKSDDNDDVTAVERYDHAQAVFFRDGMRQHEKALAEAIRQLGGTLRISRLVLVVDAPPIESAYDMATDSTVLYVRKP